jgi:serine/threonine-protein kinase
MLHCPRCGRQFPDHTYVCADDLTPLQADATMSDLSLDPLIGRVFDGKYRLDDRLGSGGMGTVYRATHLLIDRPVALKILSQRFIGDQNAQRSFRREARAAGRMQHPNAIIVTDFGATEDGWLYIVMELLEGQTLRDLLAREAPLDPARAVSFMLQTSAAVSAAHDARLIHRDLKPANIFVEDRPSMPTVIKVLDFGIAKFMAEERDDDDFNTVTQVGAIIGTPRYMSPEQCSGAGALTPASDVYSLGIILYEMLTGKPPFSADTPLAIALKHLSEPPVPPREIIPAIPEELERVVLHALAKDPRARPADANEFRRELYSVAEALGLERSDTIVAPSLAELRSAGTESPSGRLVIDLATLRQVQAASSGDNFSLRALNENARGLVSEKTPKRPDFARMDVPLDKPGAAQNRRGFRLAAGLGILAIVLVAILGSGILAARWWNNTSQGAGGHSGNDNNLNATSESSPAASASPSPEGSPTPEPKPTKKPERKKEERPSKIRSVWNKMKGIFK